MAKYKRMTTLNEEEQRYAKKIAALTWADSPKDELKMGIAMNGAIYAAMMNDIDEIIELVRQTVCSVQDIDGNHCPESPIVTFDFYGQTLYLCERCLSNARGGAYGDEIAEVAKSAQQIAQPDA